MQETHDHGIAPWFEVRDAEEAVAFYAAAFGAVEVSRFADGGRLQVARLSIDGAEFWVQDDAAAQPPTGAIRMILTVADPDAVLDQAVTVGAIVVAPVYEDHGWRVGRVTDPFGLDWEIGRELDPDHPVP
jgi:PhnB protein